MEEVGRRYIDLYDYPANKEKVTQVRKDLRWMINALRR